MPAGDPVVLETEGLAVRTATVEDVELFYALWTDPRVIKHVGFPRGLRITRGQLEERLAAQGESEFDRLLVVELKATGEAIGECKVSGPDAEVVAEPDLKLLPQFWGHKYGVEAWRALVAYEFTHTGCTAVGGSPNVENIASIKMQEAAGAVRVGEGVYHFPESMREYTTPVHCYFYRLERADWERKRSDSAHQCPKGSTRLNRGRSEMTQKTPFPGRRKQRNLLKQHVLSSRFQLKCLTTVKCGATARRLTRRERRQYEEAGRNG